MTQNLNKDYLENHNMKGKDIDTTNLTNNKLIIGIVGVPTVDDEQNNVIALYNDYKNTIIKKGGIPFMICPVSNIDYINTKLSDIPEITEVEKKIYSDMLDLCDGLIIPGGYRIYNYFQYLANQAIEKNMPTLGICMGMQSLAMIDNECYCLTKNDTNINHKQTNVKYAHKVNLVKNTLLSNIINEDEITVNSKHQYHVTQTNNFKVSAYSEDGLIEGIELPSKTFVIGVQWHPEKMIDYDINANKLFDAFIEKCVNYNNTK